MDEIDKKILNFLQENDKISYHKLKKMIKLAASTIHNRVRKMVKSGVIKSFSAIVDPGKVGYETIALLGLSVDPRKITEVAKKISTYKEAQLVGITTGDHDMVVKLISKNEKELWRFINEKIKILDGIKPNMDVSSYIDIQKMTHIIKL